MSISIRQVDGGYYYPDNPGANCFFSEAVVEGDTLVLVMMTESEANYITGVTDNFGNTWSQVPDVRSAAGGYMSDIWYAENVAACEGDCVLVLSVSISGTISGIVGAACYELVGRSSIAATVHNEAGQEVSLSSGSDPAVFLAANNPLGNGWTGTAFIEIGEACSQSATGLVYASGSPLSVVAFKASANDGSGEPLTRNDASVVDGKTVDFTADTPHGQSGTTKKIATSVAHELVNASKASFVY